LDDGDHMPLCESLDFRLAYRREVRAFGSDDPLRNVGMIGLQVFFQELGGVAFSGGVTDEDDLIRGSEIFRDLLIKRMLFGYALATVVSFLSMNQMMMEIERIVRSHLVFVCGTTSTEVLINVGGTVVNDDNHAMRLGRFFYVPTRSGFLQEFTQPRNFLYTKIMSVRPLEKSALVADAEHKLIVPMRLDVTQMLDQFDGLIPTQVMG